MAQITQKDIADELGISRETVTKALADHPNISEKTKRLINDKAEELGYVPNFFARSLVTEQSRIIGLIVPKIAHSFFSAIAEGVYRECRKRGYTVISMISFEDPHNEENNIRTLLSMRIDGVIACVTKEGSDADMYGQITRNGTPLVFFDRVIEMEGVPSVVTNDRDMAYQAVNYALSRGYRRPAHLAGLLNVNIGRDRRQGYIDALEERGIEVNHDLIVECDTTREEGRKKAMKLLTSPGRPDFIFAINDNVAHGVYDAARELGIPILGELGVIGFGNLDLGQLLTPRLTTVNIPTDQMAAAAVDLVLDPKRKKGRVVIPSELVKRESC